VKILHVVQAYYPFQEKGGPVFKVRALAETLVRRGHEVTVLTADLGLAKHQELSSALQKCPWGWRLELGGVEVIYLPTIANYRALTLNPATMEFCEKRLEAFDLVHFYGLYDLLGPTVSYFCRRREIPYVVEPMGMYRPIDRNLRLKSLWHGVLGKAFVNGAARIVATSEIEQAEILDAGFPTEKVVMRYNGIDPELLSNWPSPGKFRSQWNVPADEPLILFLSRLIPRKGADVLIEAFAEACPEKGRLVIAGPEGEPGYRAYLEASTTKSGVRERTIFAGPVYGDSKKSMYADASVFVLPSRYENFANVAAEAMVCGLPVIVSQACGISALVERERAGLVVSPEKCAVARAIEGLLSDENLYQRFKEGCARIPSRLDWARLAAQMEASYEGVIAGQKVIRNKK
jgi:glycosyltransferase involved in cell wall biosynthesis